MKYRELETGNVYNDSETKIVYLNLDQLKYDYHFQWTYNGTLDISILDDEAENLEWHRNNTRSIPFIVAENCLYEAEIVE